MNNKNFKILPMVALSAAVLNGCSSGSSSSGGSNNNPSVSGSSEISGSAVKGLMLFAPIEVFPVVDGSIGETSIASGQTSDTGSYTLDLGDFTGPVLVRAGVDDDTQMICDAVDGCGSYSADDELDLNDDQSIDFGDKFHPEDDDFSLTSLVPNVQANIESAVQITSLTDVAAQFAQAQGTLDSDSITRANVQLASVLGLTVDLVKTAPVDISNIEDGASDGAIEYAAILASLATLATENEQSDGEFLDSLAEQFSTNEGQLIHNSETDGVIDLEDIFARSVTVLDSAQATSETDLTSLQTALETNELNAADEEANTLTAIQLPENIATVNALAAAKALVSDVRTWGNVIEQEVDGPMQELETNIETIGNTLETAAQDLELKRGLENLFIKEEGVNEAKFDPLLEALEFALAVAEAIADDDETEQYNLDNIPGLGEDFFDGEFTTTGTASIDRDANTLDINGSINNQTLDLHLAFSDLNSDSEDDPFISFSESETSTLENDHATVQISGGIALETSAPIDLTQGTYHDEDIDNVDLVLLQLNVIISEKAVGNIANPVTAIGTWASVISRDLNTLNSRFGTISIADLPELDSFPLIPTTLNTNLYHQNVLNVTATAAATEELLEGTIYYATAGQETDAESEEEEAEFDPKFGSVRFVGALSNGLGDSFIGDFQFSQLAEDGDRRNILETAFSGTINTEAGDNFTGSLELASESPVTTEGDVVTVINDEDGEPEQNLSLVSLSGELNLATEESIIFSAIANSSNANSYDPNSDAEDSFIAADLNVSFTAQLTDLPLARFTLSGESTGSEDGLGKLDISYGGTLSGDELTGPVRRIQINWDSSEAETNQDFNNIVITNEENIVMTLGVTCTEDSEHAQCAESEATEGTLEEVRGAITVNGEQVASVDRHDDVWIIRYIDGTFESLQ